MPGRRRPAPGDPVVEARVGPRHTRLYGPPGVVYESVLATGVPYEIDPWDRRCVIANEHVDDVLAHIEFVQHRTTRVRAVAR